jgi:hypothetical protein
VPLLAAELPTASAIAAIAALAVLAGLAVWLIPRRQRQSWERSGVDGKELAELENSARSTLVQLLGGVALILTFVATWLQISDTRDATERTLRLTAAQQETERFTRAVEQLGSPRPEVRLGGIYGLEQAARDTPSQRETVAQLMLAYLNSNHRLRVDDKRVQELEQRNQLGGVVGDACHESVVRPWPDTQAALSVLLGTPRAVRPPLNLIGVDLIGVRIPDADFTGAVLRGTSLAGASLPDARFDRVVFAGGTDLRRACLRDARFNEAGFGRVEVDGADLSGADLAKAGAIRAVFDHTTRNDCTRFPWARQVPDRCRRP